MTSVAVELSPDEFSAVLRALQYRHRLDDAGRARMDRVRWRGTADAATNALIDRLVGVARARQAARLERIEPEWSDEEVAEFGAALSAAVVSGGSWGGRLCCGRVFGCTCRSDR